MRQTLTRFVLAGVVVAGTAAAAPAFYWVGWPGANPVAPPAIVPDTIRVDYREPTPTIVTPPTDPPGVEPPGPEEPPGVPEPATLTMAAIGLAGAAGWWWKKRKKK